MAQNKGVDFMPRIIPIRDLKNTSEISEICHSEEAPIFITKNGYGDMVVMSMEVYERDMYMSSVYGKLQAAERSVAEGRTADAYGALNSIKEKYGI